MRKSNVFIVFVVGFCVHLHTHLGRNIRGILNQTPMAAAG